MANLIFVKKDARYALWRHLNWRESFNKQRREILHSDGVWNEILELQRF